MIEIYLVCESILEWCRQHRQKLTSVAVVSILFTAIILYDSRISGRLSACPKYDDVSYLLEGTTALRQYLDGGVFSLLNTWMHSPPHAPYSAGLAFLGFLLFGIKDWAPYLLNLGYCTLYLSAVMMCFSRLSWVSASVLCIAACTVPFVGMGINEIRPDFMCALLVSLGALRIVRGSYWIRSGAYQYWTGVLFGLALMAKPTVFPSTLAILFFCFFIAAVSCALLSRISLKKLAWAAWRTYGLAAGLGTIYFAFGARHAIEYIYMVVFSKEREIWQLGQHLNNAEQFTFYLSGPGANTMLGAYTLPLYAVIISGFGAALATRKKSWIVHYVCLIAPLLLMYAIITAPTVKTPYFGLTFYIYLTLSAFFILGKLISCARKIGVKNQKNAKNEKIISTTCSLVAIISLFGFSYPSTMCRADVATRRLEDWTVRELSQTVACGADSVPTTFFVTTGNVSPEVVMYTAAKRKVEIRCRYKPFTSSVEKLHEFAHEGDYILVSVPNTPTVAEFFPAMKLRQPLIELLNKDANFVKIAEFPMPPGEFLLYEKRKPFCGFSRISGDYATIVNQSTMVVASSSCEELKIYSPFPCKRKLVAKLKGAPDQNVSFILDEKKIGELVLSPTDFTPFSCDLDLGPGEHKLKVVVTASPVAANAKDPAIFTTLQILP